MNQLYHGDNLQVLREHIASESVDLIYLESLVRCALNSDLSKASPKSRLGSGNNGNSVSRCCGTIRSRYRIIETEAAHFITSRV